MPIPTIEEIRGELALFEHASDVPSSVKTKAKEILQTLARLPRSHVETQHEAVVSENPLNEDELDTFSKALITNSQITPPLVFNKTIKNNSSFSNVLYHAYLFVAYHYPVNKIDERKPIDAITFDSILPEHLFIDFNRRQWDIKTLIAYKNRMHLYADATNRKQFSVQEIEWIKNIAQIPLITRLSHPDASVVNAAITELQSLPNEIGNKYVIPALVSCLSHINVDVVRGAINTLDTLLLSPNVASRATLRAANGIPALVSCLNHTDNRVVRKAVWAFVNLSRYPEDQAVMRAANAMHALVSCLTHRDNTIAGSILSTLCSLSEYPKNHAALRAANTIPALVSRLNQPNTNNLFFTAGAMNISFDVRDMINTFKNLSKNSENHAALRAANAIPALARFFNHNNNDNVMLNIFGSLSKNRKNHSAILNAGTLSPLITLLESSNEATKEQSRAILYDLILLNPPSIFKENITLNFIRSKQNEMPIIENGLRLLSNNHYKMRAVGQVLLNNIDFSSSNTRETSNSSMLNDINFNTFLHQVLNQTIDASRLLSTTGSRDNKTEKLNHQITLLRSLLHAKKKLLDDDDAIAFSEACIEDIRRIKPHIKHSIYGNVKRVFSQQSNFEHNILEMESRLLKIKSLTL